MNKIKRIMVVFTMLMTGCVVADTTHLAPYRDAQLVKSNTQENQSLEIPLGSIQRSGRGWEPESVLRVKGSAFRSLYKIDRNVPLEAVFSYYKTLLLAHGQNVLFQCESRNCGSSNAWANNFFKDYLLYGADNSQLLIVVQDDHDDYQVVYINRRGAGDIMVRIDDIALMASRSSEFDIVAQMPVGDLPRVRRFLRDLSPDQHVVGFVSSRNEDTMSSIELGDQYVASLKSGVGEQLNRRVRFINVADMGREVLGYNRVSFVYVAP